MSTSRHPAGHLDRLTVARALHESGRVAGAEAQYRAVLAERLASGGDDHPETLAVWHDLARLLAGDGRSDEAARIAAAATEACAATHGLDHPDTLRSRANLARIEFVHGEFEAAAALHATVLAAHEQADGAGAPVTVAARAELAWTLARLGRHEEAEAHLRTNVALTGGLHDRVVLAELLLQQDRLSEALAEFDGMLAEARPGDPALVAARQGRAAVLFALGRLAEAEAGFLAAVEGYRSPEEQGCRLARVSVQHVRAARGEAESAVVEIRALLDEARAEWGPAAPVVRLTMTALGDVLLMADQPAAAVEVFATLVELSARTCGSRDSTTLCARHMLGAALLRVGRADEADHEFGMAAAREDRPGWHSCALACRQGRARVAAARGHLARAAREFAGVAAGLTHLYGEDHPNTLEARFDVAELLRRRGDEEAARAAHEDVLAARTRVLGPEHPDTRRSVAALR